MRFLLDTAPVADWIAKSFPIIRTLFIIFITIFAIVVIVAVLAYPFNPGGGRNVILGTNNESYYATNKNRNKEGRLNRIIVISSICIIVLAILYFISFGFYKG